MDTYETRCKENEYKLQVGYEESLEGTGRSTNNGDNMEGFDEYCMEAFADAEENEAQAELQFKYAQ